MKHFVCPDCGLDYDTVMPLDTVRAVRSYPRRYKALLTGVFDDDEDPDAVVNRRPDDSTPSALEHTARAAHVIDATGPLIRRASVEDEPTLKWFDFEERSAERRYNESSRREVLAEIETACADLAATLDTVGDDDWTRVAHFDTDDRTVLDLARDAVHAGSHHLRQIEKVLEQVRGRPSSPNW